MTEDKIGEAISHPNIALIKYWGQKCISTNIPTNTSISILLPKLITKTTVMKSVEDEFHLDGKKQKINGRMSKVIAVFKDMSHDRDGICITSENNFPHSCGLASSASGYSALVKSLNNYYGLQLSTKEMSRLARLGSGSACRSIEEGISKWVDDHACKIGSWDDLRIFNIVVENKVKDVSSTEGMIRTVKTSTLFKARLEKIDNKIKLAEQYIHDKDFTKLGELVMRESNEMHAIFLDTFPPILYLNEKSMEIINEIHKINEDGFKAFYSFDAGPNPFIFVLDSHFDEVYKHFSSSYQIIVGK